MAAKRTTKRKPKMDAEDRADARRGIKQSPAEERADRAKKKPAKKRTAKKAAGKMPMKKMSAAAHKKMMGKGY